MNNDFLRRTILEILTCDKCYQYFDSFMNYFFKYDKAKVKLDYTGNIEDVNDVLNGKILNYVRILCLMKEVDKMKFIRLKSVGFMKYTLNRNHFHSQIKSEMNENYLIKKKLIIENNAMFKMSPCGHEVFSMRRSWKMKQKTWELRM